MSNPSPSLIPHALRCGHIAHLPPSMPCIPACHRPLPGHAVVLGAWACPVCSSLSQFERSERRREEQQRELAQVRAELEARRREVARLEAEVRRLQSEIGWGGKFERRYS